LSVCGFTQGAKIVDVGCGPGATLKLLTDRGFDAQGVDPSPKYLAMAKAHGQTALGSLTALPQPDGWADGLFCECVLNLAENRSAALGEISRVLKPFGHFVLSDVFALNGPDGTDGTDVTDGPLANIPLVDGTCLGGAVTLPAALDELGQAGFQILFCQDYRAALNSLAAKLVWEYGPEGLKHLPTPKADCRPGAKAGKYTYALIVSQKNG
jgi:SAM-dependent methyltransferase